MNEAGSGQAVHRRRSGMEETCGEWLEKALVELCEKVKTGLDFDREIISGLVSYCELAPPLDAKEYLDNIIGQEVGKSLIDEYLSRRGHVNLSSSTVDVSTSNLQTYVKPPVGGVSISGNKKSSKPSKEWSGSESREINTGQRENKASSEANDSRTTQKGNSKKKKGGKVISLAEASKGSIVFQQGKPCSCQARQHRLVSNCLSCGKIVCEQEGEGPCNFCGALVLREGSTYAGLEDSFTPSTEAEAAAEAYAKRLVDYDRNAAARTTVIDDQSDYYELESNKWMSKEEKDLLKKKQEEVEAAERAKRNKVLVTFDLVGRKVLVNADDVQEESQSRMLSQGPKDREVNRIKPNPSLRVQPAFIDPGPSQKPSKNKQASRNGLCLEITGRVQHDKNELAGPYVINKGKEVMSNEKVWQGPSVDGSSVDAEDNMECPRDAT